MADKLIYNGKEYTKKELANLFGMKYNTFIKKLMRGWTLEEIETGCHNDGYGIIIDNVPYKSKKEACKLLGKSYQEIDRLINNIELKQSVIINGIKYKSKTDASKKLQVSTHIINKILEGEIDIEDIQPNFEYKIDDKTFYSKKEIAEYYHKNYSSFLNKINLGWTIEQICGLQSPPPKINIKELNLSQLSKQSGIPKDIIITKLKRGYTLEKSLMPLKTNHITIKCQDKSFNSVAEMSKFYNKPIPLIYNRLNIGWTPEEAVELVPRMSNKNKK